MKTLLSLILAAAAALTPLGHFAAGQEPEPAVGGPQASKSRAIHILAAEPSSFDPVRSNKAHEMILLSLVHDRLFHVDADRSELTPGLAESWNSDESGRTWTIVLRSDAETPDGKRVTADDVVFSLQLYADPAFNSPRRPSLLFGGRAADVSALDARTVEVRTAVPSPFLPWNLSSVLILERARFETAAKDLRSWTSKLWMTADPRFLRGFGPFFVAERNAQKIVLQANPGFTGRAVGAPRTIELSVSNDPSIQATRFLKDSRFCARSVSGTELSAYTDDAEFEIVELGADSSTLFFWLNQNPRARGVDPAKLAIFQQLAFRRGIAHALDRDEVCRRAFLGHADPLHGPISPALPWSSAGGVDLAELSGEMDTAQAIGLIRSVEGVRWDPRRERFFYRTSSGHWSELGFVLYTTPSPGDVRRIAAETVAAQLARVGLKVSVEVRPFDTIVARIDETFDYEACLMFLEGGGHPADMRGIFHSGSGMHFFHPYQQDPFGWESEVDDLFDRYVVEVDPDRQDRILGDILRLWTENQPVFYLATARQFLVVRRSSGLVGYARTGKAGDPLLDRPFVERLRFERSSDE